MSYSLFILFVFTIAIYPIKPQTIYYSADFNDGKIPQGMLVIDRDGLNPIHKFIKNAWQPYIDPLLSSYIVISTSKYDPLGQADDWLISPLFNIGDDVFIEWEAMAIDSNKPDGYEVLISEGGTDVNDFTLLLTVPQETSTWQKRFINLSQLGYSNKNIRFAFRNNSYDKNVLYLDNIKIYTPLIYDAALTAIEAPKWFPIQDSQLTLKINIFNHGIRTINSMNLMVKVNDGTPYSTMLNQLNIPLQSEDEILILHNVTSSGENKIQIWINDINGQKDQNLLNDTIITTVNVYDKNKVVTRKPCLEVFTSSTSGICKGGNSNLMNALKNFKNMYTKINYQMDTPAPGDKYFTSECKSRFNYYKAASVPFMTIDGSWNKSSIQFTPSVFNDYLSVPSFFKINASYDVNNETVSVTGAITSTIDYKFPLKIYIVITEDETHNNVGTNNETVFYDVAKKMLPDSKGISINSMNAGNPVPINESYTFRNEGADKEFYTVENYNNLSVAIFIQNDETKLIEQSLQLKRTTSIEDDLWIIGIAIHPNPTSSHITLSFGDLVQSAIQQNIAIGIYNAFGERVLEIHPNPLLIEGECVVDVSSLPEGLYFVRAVLGSRVGAARFVKW